MKDEFMSELEEIMSPKDKVKAEDAPVKMKFKKKLTRKKKKASADDAARAALKGPEAKELK